MGFAELLAARGGRTRRQWRWSEPRRGGRVRGTLLPRVFSLDTYVAIACWL
jgi:hypothetical protein